MNSNEILSEMNKSFGMCINSINMIDPVEQEKSMVYLKEFLENASKIKNKIIIEENNIPVNNELLKEEIIELEEELKRKDNLIEKHLTNLLKWKMTLEKLNKEQIKLEKEPN
eukprot:TRINITY_DN11346_c0_g1_i1.p1 TRINITY_DN11346_c0_g1~~TRINITY_DN11346_c0_g1_i1.p1  ORF type:complete len:112 (+),score=34.75 TRINITY_DN11346_c0_g1_i1:6-341(+)